jgi:hypothetical protein
MIFIVFNTKKLNKNNSYNKITKFIEKTFFCSRNFDKLLERSIF